MKPEVDVFLLKNAELEHFSAWIIASATRAKQTQPKFSSVMCHMLTEIPHGSSAWRPTVTLSVCVCVCVLPVQEVRCQGLAFCVSQFCLFAPFPPAALLAWICITEVSSHAVIVIHTPLLSHCALLYHCLSFCLKGHLPNWHCSTCGPIRFMHY